MDRLEADLRYFLRELEGEDDPFRRRLVQLRIVATQRAILALMTEEREELDRQNANMERALSIIRKREEDKKKWVFIKDDYVLSINILTFLVVLIELCRSN